MSRLIAGALTALILFSPTLVADTQPTAAVSAAVKALQVQVQELRDTEAIMQLKHRYFRGIDSADLDLLRRLMHPEVTVHFIGGDYEWQLSGRDQYIEAIANNFNSSVIAEHRGVHPEIKIISPTEAEGIWYLHDNFYNLREMLYTHGTAFYHDRYVKVDGKWLLLSTQYRRHYEIVEKLDTLPNITVHYLATHGRNVTHDCTSRGLCEGGDKSSAATSSD